MKRLLTSLCCLLLAFAALAQNANEHLRFMGVPITGTIAQFQAKLVEKGCTYDKAISSSLQSGVRAFKGTFARYKVDIYAYYNTNTKIVYRVKAVISGEAQDIAEQDYAMLKNLLSQKYGTEYMKEDTKDGKECVSFLSVRPNSEYIDFQNMSSLSEVAYGTIDLFITMDQVISNRYPYIYNVHIDYNDQINTERNTDDVLDDL